MFIQNSTHQHTIYKKKQIGEALQSVRPK